ncbi:MAG: protein TolR, partial [Methylococcaceae bacterium]|nr:protein TolR [Methylococcaceae bacterium]
MNVGGSNRKSRKRRGPMAEINVVPYIDVTFVLLMIFMITAPLVQTGVDVDLPQTEAAAVDLKDEPPLIVSIKRDGSFYIDIGDRQD